MLGTFHKREPSTHPIPPPPNEKRINCLNFLIHKLSDESNNDTCLVSEQKSITSIKLKSFNIMSPNNNKSNQ